MHLTFMRLETPESRAARGGDFWHFLGAAGVRLTDLRAGNPRAPVTRALVVSAAMAKWGQGDPRWIVEEREDGTNVNNWHWCGGPRARAGGRAPGRAERAAPQHGCPWPETVPNCPGPSASGFSGKLGRAPRGTCVLPHRHLCFGRPSPSPPRP